jgi:hypothetical protein
MSMISINTPVRKSGRFVALSCALLFAMGAGSASADQPFVFGGRAMDYMSNSQIKAAAQALIAAQLPAGLPQDQAVARLTRAGMTCKRSPASSRLNCFYWKTTESEWIIHVRLDDHGAVRRARVEHERIGVDPNY